MKRTTIWLLENASDSLLVELGGPFSKYQLKEILGTELRTFIPDRQKLFTLKYENHLNSNMLVSHYYDKQIYLDSVFAYTLVRELRSEKDYFVLNNIPDIERKSEIEIDTIEQEGQNTYWFGLMDIEDGDSLVIGYHVNKSDTTQFQYSIPCIIRKNNIEALN